MDYYDVRQEEKDRYIYIYISRRRERRRDVCYRFI